MSNLFGFLNAFLNDVLNWGKFLQLHVSVSKTRLFCGRFFCSHAFFTKSQAICGKGIAVIPEKVPVSKARKLRQN